MAGVDDLIVWIIFLGQKPHHSSSATGDWLCWMSVYSLSDVEGSTASWPLHTFVCELREVLPGSQPSISLESRQVCVTAITVSGQLQCYAMEYAVAPSKNEAIDRKKARMTRAEAPKRLQDGEEKGETTKGPHAILEKTYYDTPDETMNAFRTTLFVEKSDRSEYFVVRRAASASQSLPKKISIQRREMWRKRLKDPAEFLIKQIAQGDDIQELDNESKRVPDQLRQNRHLPGTLCDACSHVMLKSELVKRLPIWTGLP